MTQPDCISIVYQGEDFVIVNKPCGISVQNENNAEGLLVGLREQLQLEKLYLVHRLDKVTSGLLLLGLTAEAAGRLSGYFAKRRIEKYYFAIVDKKPSKSQGAVIGDMYKIRDGKWALKKSTDNPAISQFFNQSIGDAKRLVVIRPASGKTHQIRVMLKSLGSPILGDKLYSGSPSDRVYLHAYALSFVDNDKQIQVSCLPHSGEVFQSEAFERGMQKYAQPWQLNWPTLPTHLLSRHVKKPNQSQ